MSFNWLDAIRLAFQYGPVVKTILDEALTNADIVTKIQNVAGPVTGMLTSIGASLFPSASEEIQLVGAAIASFDPNVVKWIQKTINTVAAAGKLTIDAPLVEDGVYGAKTKAAIEAFQTQFNLKVDGVAGTITQAAMTVILKGLSSSGTVATSTKEPAANTATD